MNFNSLFSISLNVALHATVSNSLTLKWKVENLLRCSIFLKSKKIPRYWGDCIAQGLALANEITNATWIPGGYYNILLFVMADESY